MMNWKVVLGGGAFIGAFTLGALFNPIGESAATIKADNSAKAVQTTNQNQNINCPMKGQGNGAQMGQRFAGSMKAVIANALGMTEDELQAARAGGKSVADLAKEKNIKEADLLAKMVQSRKAELEKLVKSGDLTQAQMDQMLKNMEAKMKAAIQRDTVGPMNGQGGKRGMGQRGNCNNFVN